MWKHNLWQHSFAPHPAPPPTIFLRALASHCCHLSSRSAVSDAGVHLPCIQGLAVHSLFLASDMPGAPTMSTADNMTAARQKVGHPGILGANPNSHCLKSIPICQCMDMFNGMFSLYMNGRFFQPKAVKEEFWTEDPTALTELLVRDVQWYEQHFRKVSKMITMLLRHSNDGQLRSLRRSKIQGDIVLRQAEPRMFIMNQTSHIMMLVEGTSLPCKP